MARGKNASKKKSSRGRKSSSGKKNSLKTQLAKVNRLLKAREPALQKLEQRRCALEKAITLGRKTVTKKLRDECARGSRPVTTGSKGGMWNYPAMARLTAPEREHELPGFTDGL